MRTATRTVARVGGIQLLPTTGSGQLEELTSAVPQLWQDIARDACSENYGPECAGTNEEVDALERLLAKYEAETKEEDVGYGVTKTVPKNPPLDAKSVLTLAGVSPTDANVAAFGACVKARLSKAASSTARGTLAYCAMVVKKGTKAAASHTSEPWRTQFETWRGTFDVFRAKVSEQVLPASSEEVKPYVGQYNAYRDAFIDAGGVTSAPGVHDPQLVPTWVYVAAAMGAGLFVLVQVRKVV